MKAKIPVQQIIFYKIAKVYAHFFLKKYSFTTDIIPSMDEPCLIISNHTTDYDFLMIGLAAENHVYFVSDDVFANNKFLNRLFGFFCNPICVNANEIGIKGINSILQRLKKGYNICIFPEGRHSYNGVSMPNDKSIAKLIRLSGSALVTYRISGGYFIKPRWSRNRRIGPITGSVTGIYSSKQLKNMSLDELTNLINTNTYEDAYEVQKQKHLKYIGNRKAEGMEMYAFVCPSCKSQDTIETDNNSFKCTKCGLNGVWNNEGFLEGKDLPFDNIRDWGRFTEDYYTDFVTSASDEEIIAEYETDLFIDNSKESTHGILKAYKDRFLWSDTEYKFDDIKYIRVKYADILIFKYNNSHYTFKGNSFYAWKYAKIWHIYRKDNQQI